MAANAAKAKGKKGSKKTTKKGGKSSANEGDADKKCEIHLLGGTTMSEVAFIEAWGEGAVRLHEMAPKEKLIQLHGAKVAWGMRDTCGYR